MSSWVGTLSVDAVLVCMMGRRIIFMLDPGSGEKGSAGLLGSEAEGLGAISVEDHDSGKVLQLLSRLDEIGELQASILRVHASEQLGGVKAGGDGGVARLT